MRNIEFVSLLLRETLVLNSTCLHWVCSLHKARALVKNNYTISLFLDYVLRIGKDGEVETSLWYNLDRFPCMYLVLNIVKIVYLHSQNLWIFDTKHIAKSTFVRSEVQTFLHHTHLNSSARTLYLYSNKRAYRLFLATRTPPILVQWKIEIFIRILCLYIIRSSFNKTK